MELITTNLEEIRLDVKIRRFKDIAITYELVEGGGAKKHNVIASLSEDTIRVSGSDAVLEALGDEIVVGVIDLGNIRDTVLTYPINLPADVTNLSGVTSVEIGIKFIGVSTATIPVRGFNIINVPEGMEVDMNTKYLDIVVRGPASAMKDLEAADIIVTVDFAGKEPGSMESYPVAITFSSDFKDVGEVGTYQVWATLAPVQDEDPDEG